VVSADQGAKRLDGHIRREKEEARSDQLLRPAFGRSGVEPATGEQPDDDEAGGCLDQAVRSESDQGDRTGSDPRAKCNRKLDEMPRDPAPGQESGSPLKALPLDRFSNGQPTE
jgi:hypothetical protein